MEERINNIITCGVRWGYEAPSFAQLLLDNNIAILEISNKNIETFRSTQKNDLIALKDGYNIIALGKYKDIESIKTWEHIIDKYLSDKEGNKYSEKNKNQLSDDYWFDLSYDKMDVIEVEEWIVMNPAIYYPMRMSTVTIRDPQIVLECKTRFSKKQLEIAEQITLQIQNHLKIAQDFINTYNLAKNSENDKEQKESVELLKNATKNIEQALAYDSANKEALQIKSLINSLQLDDATVKTTEEKEQSKKVTSITGIYNKKIASLKLWNLGYISFFLTLSGLYGWVLIELFLEDSLPEGFDPITYIITKTTISITFTILVFWVARFFNRRIHENVHLIEEYEHRNLLLDVFKFFKLEHSNNDKHHEITIRTLTALMENPTKWLSRKKSDGIPTEFLEIINIMQKSKTSDKNSQLTDSN